MCTLIVYAGHWKDVLATIGTVEDNDPALISLKNKDTDKAWEILVSRGCKDRDLTFAFLLQLSCWVLRAR
jgi:hypothetical protein